MNLALLYFCHILPPNPSVSPSSVLTFPTEFVTHREPVNQYVTPSIILSFERLLKAKKQFGPVGVQRPSVSVPSSPKKMLSPPPMTRSLTLTPTKLIPLKRYLHLAKNKINMDQWKCHACQPLSHLTNHTKSLSRIN